MDFFGIGLGEIILILIVALIVFGPGRLPEIARSIGRFTSNIKRMSSDLSSTVTKELSLEDKIPMPKKDPFDPAVPAAGEQAAPRPPDERAAAPDHLPGRQV